MYYHNWIYCQNVHIMIIYRFKIICTVRHALRTVNIKALLLHALRRTVVIKYMSLPPTTVSVADKYVQWTREVVAWSVLSSILPGGPSFSYVVLNREVLETALASVHDSRARGP